MTAVDFTDNSVVYEEYANGNLYKSTDGGATWFPSWTNSGGLGINVCDQIHNTCTQPDKTTGYWYDSYGNQYDPVSFVMPFVMAPSNHSELLAATDMVYRTLDGASTWYPISGGLSPYSCTVNNAPGTCYHPATAIAVAPSNDNYIYVGFGTTGQIVATTDGGNTWGTVTNAFYGTPSTTVTGLAVDPTDPKTVYATFGAYSGTGTGQHVFKSTDAGATWNDISASNGTNPPLPNVPFTSVAVDPVNHQQILAGSDAGIYISGDGGNSWERLGQGLPDVAVDQIFTDRTGTYLYAATHGRGMWVLPLVTGTFYVGGQGGAVSINENDGSIIRQYQLASGVCLCGAGGVQVNMGSLYYVDQGNVLHAVSPNSGAENWRYNLGSAPTAALSVDLSESTLFVGTADHSLYAFNNATGAVRYRYTLGGYATSSPVGIAATAPTVMVQASDNYLYYIDSTGKLAWRKALAAKNSTQISHSAPLFYASSSGTDLYIVGSSAGVVYALDGSGRQVWSFATGSPLPIDATPVLDDAPFSSTVYVGGHDGYLYALNGDTGALIWKSLIAAGSEPTTAVQNNQVLYVGDSATNKLYAVASTTGAILWAATSPASGSWHVPVVNAGMTNPYDDSIVCDVQGGTIWALRTTDGSVVWSNSSLASSNPPDSDPTVMKSAQGVG